MLSVRLHAHSMPCARAARQWEIRPTFALQGIRRTRALMWQQVRGLARACWRGVGYRMNYNDPIQEEQEMVCLEVRNYYGFYIPLEPQTLKA